METVKDDIQKGFDASIYLNKLIQAGEIDPKCMTCQISFIPEKLKGKKINDIFAPRHRVLLSCKSGKHPHCTCDSCF